MNRKEENPTRKWIMDALLELLKYKDYHDITIAQIADKAGLGRRTFYRHFKAKDEVMEETARLLMEDFADTLAANQADTLEIVTLSYFEFWETHIDILMLLNKAKLLYFFEDNLLSYFFNAAIRSGHISGELSKDEIWDKYQLYKYEFAFKLAGFWKITIVWCTESPRKTPEEMSRLVCRILGSVTDNHSPIPD